MCIMGNGNDPPAAYHPGNFLMKNMNPTNSGLSIIIILISYLGYGPKESTQKPI